MTAPIVCPHGGWQNADSRQPQVEELVDEYSVVTTELRGHGKTGSTETRRYTVFVQSSDTIPFLGVLTLLLGRPAPEVISWQRR